MSWSNAFTEAHNELGANRIAADEHYQALLKSHGVLESMTKELVSQEKIEKDKAELATRTITPIQNVTDPRIASELKKQLASYMETNKHKAEADGKLTEERMHMEEAVTHYFAEEYKKQSEAAERAAEQQHAASVRFNDETVKNAESARRVAQLGLVGQASAFLISKQQERAGLKAILLKEQTDLQDAHQREINEQHSFIAQMDELAGHRPENGPLTK